MDKGAVLTTHYMEEADALCHRIGIMINGQLECVLDPVSQPMLSYVMLHHASHSFRCLGTSQHLKNRFGHGYQLEIKLASMNDSTITSDMSRLDQLILHHFPSSTLLKGLARE